MMDKILKAIEIIMAYIIVLALTVAFILAAPVLASIVITCGMIMIIADSIQHTLEVKNQNIIKKG